MVDFPRADPWQRIQSTKLKEQNARGALARPLAIPVLGSHPHGFCQGCAALLSAPLTKLVHLICTSMAIICPLN